MTVEPPVDVGGQFADQSSLRHLIVPVRNTSAAQVYVGRLIQLPRIIRRSATPDLTPDNREPCGIVGSDELASTRQSWASCRKRSGGQVGPDDTHSFTHECFKCTKVTVRIPTQSVASRRDPECQKSPTVCTGDT